MNLILNFFSEKELLQKEYAIATKLILIFFLQSKTSLSFIATLPMKMIVLLFSKSLSMIPRATKYVESERG